MPLLWRPPAPAGACDGAALRRATSSCLERCISVEDLAVSEPPHVGWCQRHTAWQGSQGPGPGGRAACLAARLRGAPALSRPAHPGPSTRVLQLPCHSRPLTPSDPAVPALNAAQGAGVLTRALEACRRRPPGPTSSSSSSPVFRSDSHCSLDLLLKAWLGKHFAGAPGQGGWAAGWDAAGGGAGRSAAHHSTTYDGKPRHECRGPPCPAMHSAAHAMSCGAMPCHDGVSSAPMPPSRRAAAVGHSSAFADCCEHLLASVPSRS